MGKPLSPSQIPQKNISTLSKLHKTTSECWQRTSGNQKSRSLSSKTVGKNIKDEKGDKGGGLMWAAMTISLVNLGKSSWISL